MPPTGAPAPERVNGGDATPQAALWRTPTVDGSIVRFADAAGGEVVLAWDGTCFQHAGAVHARGPCALPLATYDAVGLSTTEAAALEFVAAWIGAPFDATTAVGRPPQIRWGTWRLGGATWARALLRWQATAPASFDALLAAYGVSAVAEDGDAGGESSVVVRDADGRTRSGAAAEQAIATDARLVAALARAGRAPDAQRAQLETVADECVAPLRAALAAGAVDIRIWAALLSIALEHGVASLLRLLRAPRPPFLPGDPPRTVAALLTAALHANGHGADAERLLWVVASPELACHAGAQ